MQKKQTVHEFRVAALHNALCDMFEQNKIKYKEWEDCERKMKTYTELIEEYGHMASILFMMEGIYAALGEVDKDSEVRQVVENEDSIRSDADSLKKRMKFMLEIMADGDGFI